MTILPFATQIKDARTAIETDSPIKGEVIFCVQGVISPILANVFLHYIVDLWVHQWRRQQAAGQIIVCRYADDLVLGCQYEVDGKKLLVALKDRLAHFGLSLHEGKTRLIAFGRFAAQRRQAAGLRRPETSWASRTIAARPGAAGSWSNGRRKPSAW